MPAPVLLGDQSGDPLVNAVELGFGGEAVGAGFGYAGVLLLHQSGDTDFKKLVEVGTDD